MASAPQWGQRSARAKMAGAPAGVGSDAGRPGRAEPPGARLQQPP